MASSGGRLGTGRRLVGLEQVAGQAAAGSLPSSGRHQQASVGSWSGSSWHHQAAGLASSGGWPGTSRWEHWHQQVPADISRDQQASADGWPYLSGPQQAACPASARGVSGVSKHHHAAGQVAACWMPGVRRQQAGTSIVVTCLVSITQTEFQIW